jgi:hypothetical protein
MAKDADYIDKTTEHQYVGSTVNINRWVVHKIKVPTWVNSVKK